MNTLKKYIEMSKKAEDIQKNWNEQIWDTVFYNHPDFKERGIGKITFIDKQFKKECGKDTIVYYIDVNPVGCYPKEYLIWLPDQAQLQKMIKGVWQNVFLRFLYFYEDTDILKFGSMEQFLLAFVMKEKHHKIWNGKDWINES